VAANSGVFGPVGSVRQVGVPHTSVYFLIRENIDQYYIQ